jgi:hypothetical protein
MVRCVCLALERGCHVVEADALYKDVFGMDVGFLSSISAVVLSGNYLARDAIVEALGFAESAYARHPQFPYTIGQLSGVLARAGQRERSETLKELLKQTDTFGAPFGLALAVIGAREIEEAADWLEKAIEQRDLWVSFLLNVGNIGGRVIWTSRLAATRQANERFDPAARFLELSNAMRRRLPAPQP